MLRHPYHTSDTTSGPAHKEVHGEEGCVVLGAQATIGAENTEHDGVALERERKMEAGR
jgi:hypothetical protein